MIEIYTKWRDRRTWAAAFAALSMQSHRNAGLTWWEQHMLHHHLFSMYMTRASSLQAQGFRL
jgi:hypothetical protein